MKILVIGDPEQLAECKQKFGLSVDGAVCASWEEADTRAGTAAVVFDFVSAGSNTPVAIPDTQAAIFVDTTRTTLAAWMTQQRISRLNVYGFCGLRSFLNREVLEVVVPLHGTVEKLEDVCRSLGTAFQIVDDQVGMVSPRVIGMIINEAYYTLEEGTASREDIDLAMKLGTSYPFGPFEWAERIGQRNVVDLLEAVYRATQDERYRVCPLLIEQARLA